MSYHDRIHKRAEEIRVEREKTYTPNSDNIHWSPKAIHHLVIIWGKVLRLIFFMKDIEKARDEIIDIYNHSALFYEEITPK